mmetsp:Transcript_33142/g.61829  ORF Transcript_33142/g.61829 Transcript_33142/m.61829 type:complete len:112 (+) Transcript_33142:108-443(+)
MGSRLPNVGGVLAGKAPSKVGLVTILGPNGAPGGRNCPFVGHWPKAVLDRVAGMYASKTIKFLSCGQTDACKYEGLAFKVCLKCPPQQRHITCTAYPAGDGEHGLDRFYEP